MAAGMVAHGEESGALRPGMRVVEYTGGSTGSSLAMVCAAKGYRAHLVSADCFAAEKLRTMRAFGAEVEVLESEGGKVTPELFDRFKVRIAELAAEPETWWAEQFVNPGNATAYRTLAQEIVDELGEVDGFVMGVGTGGCFTGVAGVLKERDPSTRCVAIEPATSQNLSGGRARRTPARGHRRRLPAAGRPARSRRRDRAASPTRTHSRRRASSPCAKGCSPARRRARTCSWPDGSQRSSDRGAGRDDPDRLGPEVPRGRPVQGGLTRRKRHAEETGRATTRRRGRSSARPRHRRASSCPSDRGRRRTPGRSRRRRSRA